MKSKANPIAWDEELAGGSVSLSNFTKRSKHSTVVAAGSSVLVSSGRLLPLVYVVSHLAFFVAAKLGCQMLVKHFILAVLLSCHFRRKSRWRTIGDRPWRLLPDLEYHSTITIDVNKCSLNGDHLETSVYSERVCHSKTSMQNLNSSSSVHLTRREDALLYWGTNHVSPCHCGRSSSLQHLQFDHSSRWFSL